MSEFIGALFAVLSLLLRRFQAVSLREVKPQAYGRSSRKLVTTYSRKLTA